MSVAATVMQILGFSTSVWLKKIVSYVDYIRWTNAEHFRWRSSAGGGRSNVDWQALSAYDTRIERY